jgi:D-3-phosphoglycerate dehydrogenase
VRQAVSLDDLFSRAQIVTVHVPLGDGTRALVNAERLALMKPGGMVLNFARGPIVDDAAVLASLDAGHLGRYVTDFPGAANKGHPKVIALPHLGASTREAEENCAIMVAQNLRDFLENGNIRHAVNFPEALLPRMEGNTRIAIANANVPNMVGQISTALASGGLNISDLLNKSRGDLAYTLVDVDGPIPDGIVERIASIEGVLSMRVIPDAA